MNSEQPKAAEGSAEHPFTSLRNFSIYTVLSVFQKASTFLLLPVYTYYMSPDDFGIVSVAMAVATIVPPLVMLNTSEYVYFTALKRERDWKREVSSIVCFQVLIASLVFLLEFLGWWVSGGSEIVWFGVSFFPYLLFSIAFTVLSAIFTSYSLVLQALNEVKSFSRLNISFSLLFAALVVLLLIVFEQKAMSFIYANLLLYSVFGIIILGLIHRRFGLALHWRDVRRGLAYSVPLIPHTLSHWGKGYLDRVFLGAFVSTAAAGLFHFAFTIGSVLVVGLEAFARVNNPLFFVQFEDPERRHIVISRLHFAAAFFSIAGIVISFFSRELMWFFDDQYTASYLLLPYLVTGNLLYLVYLGVVNGLFIKKKTLIVSMLTSSSGVIASLGSYLLISNFGLNGAAISHVFSNLSIALIVYVGVQRHNPANWKLYRLLFMLALPLAGIALNLYSLHLVWKIAFSLFCIGWVLWTVRKELAAAMRALGFNVKFF